ncbi:hypothetical protein N0V85_007680, partial [Neurospora sp. IMI 360204]
MPFRPRAPSVDEMLEILSRVGPILEAILWTLCLILLAHEVFGFALEVNFGDLDNPAEAPDWLFEEHMRLEEILERDQQQAPATTRRPTGPIPYLEYPSPNATSTSSNISTTKPKRYLLFFISGNPGLIDYYAPFFTHLRSLLNELESKSASASPGQQPITFHIYGQNLIGFSDSDHQPFSPGSPETEPFLLEEQIAHLYDSLATLNQEKGPFDEIILAGHSVGSFLSLEILHRSLHSSSTSTSLPITTALLLFPTIHQMHLSPSGLHLSRIRSIPFLNNYAHVLAKSFVDLVPGFALRWITRRVLGMSEHGSE